MTLRYLPELGRPVDLCLPNGRLNPDAVGRTRTPLHRTPLRGWGRTKRWEYWGIVTPEVAIGVTIASIDYAAVPSVYLVDRRTGRDRVVSGLVPLATGTSIPDDLPPFTAEARWTGGALRAESGVDATHLTARVDGIELDVVSRDAGDALGVVVPWSQRLFQYTLKDVARPVEGTLVLDGERIAIGEGSWAVLDRGRGRWPYRMTWNWSAGSGVVGGRRIGLQLGGKWTDGTGSTENAVFVDGVQHYIGEELDWQYDLRDPASPWRIEGERVNVTLTPWHRRRETTNALVVLSAIHQAFGTWTGWMLDGDDERVSVDGLVGWAEEAKNRW